MNNINQNALNRFVFGLATLLMIMGLAVWPQTAVAQDDPDKAERR